MTTFHSGPTEVDVPLQLLISHVVHGRATDAEVEVEAARKAAGLSLAEFLLVGEFLRRETAVTFAGEILVPLC